MNNSVALRGSCYIFKLGIAPTYGYLMLTRIKILQEFVFVTNKAQNAIHCLLRETNFCMSSCKD